MMRECLAALLQLAVPLPMSRWKERTVIEASVRPDSMNGI